LERTVNGRCQRRECKGIIALAPPIGPLWAAAQL